MKKIAIRFSIDEHDDVKSIAQHLQRFIIEDNYKTASIAQKIINNERIVLEVGMEKNMPDFEALAEEFDEEEIEYEFYKSLNGDWDKCELNDLELDRTPQWINTLIGFNLILSVIMTVVQTFYIYDWYTQKYEWHGIVSTVSSLIATLIPIYGSFVAYWSATELSHWGSYEAFLAFFGYYLPILGFFVYLAWIIIHAYWSDRWHRFWHKEFN